MPDDRPATEVRTGPAHRLTGLTLQDGWKVVSMFARTPDTTGGKYSVCYRIERNGQRAFLKALDFHKAVENKDLDFPQALEALLFAFNFERQLLKRCADRKLDRVIAPIGDGKIDVGDPG